MDSDLQVCLSQIAPRIDKLSPRRNQKVALGSKRLVTPGVEWVD